MADFLTTLQLCKKRRDARKLQIALYGSSADPSVGIDLENITKILNAPVVKMLIVYENALNALLQHAVPYNNSPTTRAEIQEFRVLIASCAKYAAESVGFVFDLVPGIDCEEHV